MSVPTTKAAQLFAFRRAARALSEYGVKTEKSTRDVLCNAQTHCLAAYLLGLPADFVAEVFGDSPVKEAEGITEWALGMQGFKRVDALDGYATRRGRIVSPECRRAAYEATMTAVRAA